MAGQFGAKFLFNRGEIGVEIDKQSIDRSIDHLYPTSRFLEGTLDHVFDFSNQRANRVCHGLSCYRN
jgi:hypothetical protein